MSSKVLLDVPHVSLHFLTAQLYSQACSFYTIHISTHEQMQRVCRSRVTQFIRQVIQFDAILRGVGVCDTNKAFHGYHQRHSEAV